MNFKTYLLFSFFLLVVIITGRNCYAQADTTKKDTIPQVIIDPQNPAALISAIIAYMECDECTDGELARLLQYKQAAMPYLVNILEKGPSPAKKEMLQKKLEQAYDQLTDTAHLTKKQYTEMYQENFKALYFIRSAQALAAIGGVEAKTALTIAAARDDYRSDVKSAIKRALLQLQ